MDDFEYLDPKDLNELVIHIKKAQKEKKDLTFSFEYAKILSQLEKGTKPTESI